MDEQHMHHIPLDGKHIFIFALVGVAAIAFVMSRGANKAANSQSTMPDYVNTTPLYYGDSSNGSLPGGSTGGGVFTPPSAPGPVIPTPAPYSGGSTNKPSPAPATPAVPAAPATPVAPAAPAVPILSKPPTPQSAPQYVQAVNHYTSTIGWNNLSKATQNSLHTNKTAAVRALGETNDSWGIVRTASGQIDTVNSAKFRNVGSLNTYVSTNKSSLSTSNIATLHAQKVQMEAALGNTVTADGHVFNAAGRPVGSNGMG